MNFVVTNERHLVKSAPCDLLAKRVASHSLSAKNKAARVTLSILLTRVSP